MTLWPMATRAPAVRLVALEWLGVVARLGRGAGAVDEQAVDADAQGEGAGVERGGADSKAVAGVARAAHVFEGYVLEPSHRR